jgi:GxxExxY protein
MIAIWRLIKAGFITIVRGAKSPDALTERVIACAIIVSNTIGAGLPEVIYENALAHELRKAGLAVCQQRAVVVCYDGMIVGDYMADLLVESTILVELKAIKSRTAFDTGQCMNYLKATGLPHSLLLNFGNRRLEVKRVVNGP